jgi:hypothetical protein
MNMGTRRTPNLSRAFLIAIIILAAGTAIFAAQLIAQDDVWQLMRADYGWKNQRTDVTGLLQDLLSRGGVNGRIAVNNQTMGGDPAVGKDKTLRVFAQNSRGQEREFDFNEDGAIDVRMFTVARRGNDWDDRPHGDHDRDRDRDRDDARGLQIIRGYYGVQGRTVNVTDLLRSRVRDGMLSMNVSNNALGGDPAIGADKVLIVIYRYQGEEQATAVREGNTLSIP